MLRLVSVLAVVFVFAALAAFPWHQGFTTPVYAQEFGDGGGGGDFGGGGGDPGGGDPGGGDPGGGDPGGGDFGGGDPGAGGFDPGAGGFDPGAGGFDPGAGGFDPGAGGFDPGAGGFDPGAGGFGGFDPSGGGFGGFDPSGGGFGGFDPGAGVFQDFGSFDFGGGPPDFTQFGDFSQFGAGPGETGAPMGPVDFDFGGFFSQFQDPSVFQGPGTDLGDFSGVFGSFEDFQGGFKDFSSFGGDIGNLGGFFERPPEALEAFNMAQGLRPDDLQVLGGGFARDLIKDMDFFGFQELEGGFIGDLLRSASGAGGLDMGAKQWAGALGAMGRDDLFGLGDGVLSSAFQSMGPQDFLLMAPDNARALFDASVLNFDESAGGSFRDNLSQFGPDAFGMLGAMDHSAYFEMADRMGDIFSSVGFGAVDPAGLGLGGDDIGAMMAAMGAGLGDRNPEELLAAIGHMQPTDFVGTWSGDIATQVIGKLGVQGVLGLDQLEGIMGSFRRGEDVSVLKDNLRDIVQNLDFETHGGILGGFAQGALQTFGKDEFLNFGDVGRIVGLVNSTGIEGIFDVPVDNLDAILGALGTDNLGNVDPTTFGGLASALPDELLAGYDGELKGAMLSTLGADLFNSAGMGFGQITGGATSFDFLADIAKVIQEGQEVFLATLADGSSPLQQGALDIFGPGLFGGQAP